MDASKDSEVYKVFVSMVTDYVNGRPWAVMGFDILRAKEITVEKVFCMLMSESDYQTMSLMMQAIHYPGVKERVFNAVLAELDAIKKEREGDGRDN